MGEIFNIPTTPLSVISQMQTTELLLCYYQFLYQSSNFFPIAILSHLKDVCNQPVRDIYSTVAKCSAFRTCWGHLQVDTSAYHSRTQHSFVRKQILPNLFLIVLISLCCLSLLCYIMQALNTVCASNI